MLRFLVSPPSPFLSSPSNDEFIVDDDDGDFDDDNSFENDHNFDNGDDFEDGYDIDNDEDEDLLVYGCLHLQNHLY